MSFIIVLLIAILVAEEQCFLLPKNRNNQNFDAVLSDDSYKLHDAGEPLLLTPYIKGGRIDDAKKDSTVNHKDFGNTKSYSGYLTVNEEHKINLFFWFFPAEDDFANAPVILSLNGDPNNSSLVGLFSENGPFKIEDSSVTQREYRWTKKHSVLYIDAPAGTGFSFTDRWYSVNQTMVTDELYEALKQFFTLFVELQKNDFFIAGQGFAGKYATSVAYLIHQKNPDAAVKINLKGLAINSGVIDPVNQLEYAKYFYQHGLLDKIRAAELTEVQQRVAQFIDDNAWLQALQYYNHIFHLFREDSGIKNGFNFLNAGDINDKIRTPIETFLQKDDTRTSIHVGKTEFSDGATIYLTMRSDYMSSVADKVSELLNHYRILFYNGQVDIVTPYPAMVSFVKKLQFDGADDYKNATRKVWKVEEQVAGYVKVGKSLTEVLVKNAGHLTAYDQPKWCYDLISKFIKDQPIVS